MQITPEILEWVKRAPADGKEEVGRRIWENLKKGDADAIKADLTLIGNEKASAKPATIGVALRYLGIRGIGMPNMTEELENAVCPPPPPTLASTNDPRNSRFSTFFIVIFRY